MPSVFDLTIGNAGAADGTGEVPYVFDLADRTAGAADGGVLASTTPGRRSRWQQSATVPQVAGDATVLHRLNVNMTESSRYRVTDHYSPDLLVR